MAIPTGETINADFPFHLHSISVGDAEMAHIYTNPQDQHSPIVVFLHGNPTSSYLWRNIIPHVRDCARCIAPDLIGMGASSNPPNFDGRFATHARYLEIFLSKIKPAGSRITLVLHDWGSALGLDWARRHSDEVKGLVLMEFVHPWPTWEYIGTSDAARDLFKMFRHPDEGRRLLVDGDASIKQVLPGSIVRKLTEAEMDQYRAPFVRLEDREPLYRWPNELPIAGQPADVHEAVGAYHEWLLASRLKKLFLWVSPGALITEKDVTFYTTRLHNCHTVFLSEGLHYVQEDHPHLIVRSIEEWLKAEDNAPKASEEI